MNSSTYESGFGVWDLAPRKGVLASVFGLQLQLMLMSLILAANTAFSATPTADFGGDESLTSDASARELLMEDVRKYQDRIVELEQTQGAYADGLTEHLLGLGLALQRNGDHERAVEVFKRGVHLSRINDGLDSSRQMAMLQGEISSHIALGALATADERQRYLFRIQAKTLSATTRGEALMQHALWQRQAYEAKLGEDPYARLLRMWSLYRLALSEFAQIEGKESLELLPALYGMLRSQYLASGFVAETTNGRFRSRGVYSDEESRQLAYSGHSYKQGLAVIRAIYDVKLAQDESDWRDDADLAVMIGDWNLWHGKRTDAMEIYEQLWQELAGEEAAEAYREKLFGSPQVLPNLAGVRALPESVPERNGVLLLEFGVSVRGRVVDVQRLDEDASNNEQASDIIRRMRQTIFRPRFSDGMAVDTGGLRWAYDSTQWFKD